MPVEPATKSRLSLHLRATIRGTCTSVWRSDAMVGENIKTNFYRYYYRTIHSKASHLVETTLETIFMSTE